MRHIKTIALKTTLLCVSGLGIFAASAPAYAGGCGLGVSPALCQTGVSVNSGTGPVFDNMSVNINQPLGHLRSVNYQRAPHISITRVHGMMDSAALSDFPSAFTDGCNPTSTAYCRENTGVPVNVQFSAPPAQPVQAQPVQNFNFAPAPRTVAIGGGYDPSKFMPRQYGENTFTPGTVYAPTSFVNRNPADAARVLAENGFTTVGYARSNFSTQHMNMSAPPTPQALSFAQPPQSFPVQQPVFGSNMTLAGGPVSHAPNVLQQGALPPGANYLGSVITGQTTTGSSAPSGNVVGGVDGGGGYWEQVSGLTMFGDTVATSVVCRRQATQQTQQVVSPVYGIPQPVPTPVPYFVDVPVQVRGNAIPQGCRPAAAPFISPLAPQHAFGPRPHMAPFPAAMPGVLPFGPTRMGPQFGGGFGQNFPISPTAPQLGGYSAGNMGPQMNSGWTY